ncbi:2-haloalkanoic acid dehalogenase [Methanosarcina siciliae T4/M]|uniref:2-haloalkanoic acid dehalogenase n=1 Tax=Methanosarcina siciliae T4/M TaxID=1434120 RepID=A0A0E3P2U6_9EURY|nr:HAD family hydrolase [Methanosarcina siciliae]AKB27699.1 2-haloalkanoic acid dehalogenase [Methanosarcina siciliae T4/M]
MMVFFDIDGTLLDHKSAEFSGVELFYQNYHNFFEIDFNEFYSIWCELAEKHFKRYLAKKCSFEEQRIERIKELYLIRNINLSNEEALKVFDYYLFNYESSWKPYDDVIPCLKKLSNLKMGVISNGDPGQQKLKLSKMGISRYFVDIIVAGEFHVAKPCTEIFESACKRNGEEPEKCFYVGDAIETDIIPCEKIGMKGIWINRGNKTFPNKNIKSIFSLEELVNVLYEDMP